MIIYRNNIILLIIVIFTFISYIIQSNYIVGIRYVMRSIYMNSKNSVNVYMIAGLGNRLMSFAGIILLSIYYEYKPLSILLNIFDS